MVEQYEFSLSPHSRGFHLITSIILQQIGDLPQKGLLNIHIKHTSAGLTINENADPTVRVDFESIFNQLIPEGQPFYQHNYEGDDDMPAHIKTSLVGNSITIPITNHRLNLGTWQGIYLCEFRNNGGSRKIVATVFY